MERQVISDRRMSLSVLTESEDDLALYAEMQEKALDPIKEDLADWLNGLLGTSLTEDTFFSHLENGALLCQLANFIEGTKISPSLIDKPAEVPYRKLAQPQTWFARDNTANFLSWCHSFGVKRECMFETDDLVLGKRPRSIILCLLEIARMAYRNYGIDPPSLVKMEREIDEKDMDIVDMSVVKRHYLALKDVVIIEADDNVVKKAGNCGSVERKGIDKSETVLTKVEKDVQLNETLSRRIEMNQSQQPSRCKSAEKLFDRNGRSNRISSNQRPVSSDGRETSASSVDCEVRRMARQYSCGEFVKRIEQGTYEIFGRTVLIRLLKGRHLMVRVGGGWDTLGHYLITHKPTKIQRIKRSEFNTDAQEFLYAEGRYTGQRT